MKSPLGRMIQVGAAGCTVDAIVLYVTMALGMGFTRARLISYAYALIVSGVLIRAAFPKLQLAGDSRLVAWTRLDHRLPAIALGGLINLLTYQLVLATSPHYPAIFAFAVVLGWIAGGATSFAAVSASQLAAPRGGSSLWLKENALTNTQCLILVQAVFWLTHLHEAGLPGLYMDAVNPDYLAARTLNPQLSNPVWVQPTVGVPVLGSLYHGVQNYYVGLPVFALLGFNMLAVRIAQGIFASGVLVMTHLVVKRIGGSMPLALTASLCVATELAFIASFRTQMYIVMSGTFWLLLAVYLALGRGPSLAFTGKGLRRFSGVLKHPWFLSGVCGGLAVYSYFVFVFFVPALVALAGRHTRNWRPPALWLGGFVAGMQTYVLGYLLAVISLGGIFPALEWIKSSTQGLDPMASALPLMQRLDNAWSVLVLTLQNMGNELMIFGASEPGGWAVWKVRLLVSVPLLLILFEVMRRWGQPRHSVVSAQGTLIEGWHLAFLPVAFFAVSLVFGDRLWSHHYSPLIPLSYVILFTAVSRLSALKRFVSAWYGAALLVLLLIGNVYQERVFFNRLTESGGVKYFSNAMNRMAEDALTMRDDVVHVFPEWGFGMPFAFLTGNRKPYEDRLDEEILARHLDAGSTLRVYHWEAETGDLYEETLETKGYQVHASGTYRQRDNGIAFYWIEASAPRLPYVQR